MSPASEQAKGWIVLIVDDHHDNVMVARAALEYHGAEVHVAANGEEGLIVLESLDPTLILLDLAMPVMDGWKMLKRLQALPNMEQVPVIAVTAHAMDSDRSRVLDAGFDEFIAKPYDVTTFVARLKQVLDRKINAR
jgi:CheY-like chemotaxis protein